MQEENRGGGSQSHQHRHHQEAMKQNQDRRLKLLTPPAHGGDHQIPQQHHNQNNNQPQTCPRCESQNTKFCYFNNYSLSQPRYFCKACRRYWTQGGTLRNVPVGGGCRKASKRTKTSSASSSASSVENSMSQPPPPPPQAMITTNAGVNPINPIMGNKESDDLGSVSGISYYSGGGFMSTIPAIPSLSGLPRTFSQAINQMGGDHLGGSSTNLALLQGFNNNSVNLAGFGSQQSQFYQMGNKEVKTVNPINYPSKESLNIESTMPTPNHHNWHQSFVSNANPSVDTTLWSISTTSSITNNTVNADNNSGGSSSPLNTNQWPDLPGYGPAS